MAKSIEMFSQCVWIGLWIGLWTVLGTDLGSVTSIVKKGALFPVTVSQRLSPAVTIQCSLQAALI